MSFCSRSLLLPPFLGGSGSATCYWFWNHTYPLLCYPLIIPSLCVFHLSFYQLQAFSIDCLLLLPLIMALFSTFLCYKLLKSFSVSHFKFSDSISFYHSYSPCITVIETVFASISSDLLMVSLIVSY